MSFNDVATRPEHDVRAGALSMSGRLHWSAGLYGFHEEGSRDQQIYLRARVPSSSVGDPDNPDDGVLGPGTPDAQDSTASFLQRIDTTSYAAYGQAKYDLTDKVGLTVGLRYTDEAKEARIDATSTATAPGGPPRVSGPDRIRPLPLTPGATGRP